MNVAETLKAAKAHIGTPDRWHQGEYGLGVSDAIIADGFDCPCCMIGAVCFVTGKPDKLRNLSTYTRILEEVTDGDIVDFNDDPDTTHEMVMDAYDRAIELAEQSS